MPRLRPLRHLMRGVWLQVLRRNEIYVVAILLGLYLLGALVLRVVGVGTPQTARFIAGLGLQLGGTLAALLVIVMGARQVPDELELRTIYPILAKPVTRGQVLLGKALPTWLAGAAAMLLFTLVTLAVTPRLPYQHWGVLAEALALKMLALAMLTALVFWVALWLPVGVTVLVVSALHFFGDMLANVAAQSSVGGGALRLAAGLIPDFSLLDHCGRYVDGGAALAAPALAGLALYGALWTAIFAILAAARFRRMAL